MAEEDAEVGDSRSSSHGSFRRFVRVLVELWPLEKEFALRS